MDEETDESMSQLARKKKGVEAGKAKKAQPKHKR